jgi:hypothetical protein
MNFFRIDYIFFFVSKHVYQQDFTNHEELLLKIEIHHHNEHSSKSQLLKFGKYS